MKIAILTSPNQWFIPHAKILAQKINGEIFYSHTEISGFEIVFVLSYHKIIGAEFLAKNRHNIVIHASALPRGRGWAPLFWQVINGESEVVFSLFQATPNADDGDIYMQKTLFLDGLELYDELRQKQADLIVEMCLEFLRAYPNITPKKQVGEASFYPKRTPKDGEIDPNRSINEIFNLLRTCKNDEFPAFFYKNGRKFLLKIERGE